jgi:hypothetical protein
MSSVRWRDLNYASWKIVNRIGVTQTHQDVSSATFIVNFPETSLSRCDYSAEKLHQLRYQHEVDLVQL